MSTPFKNGGQMGKKKSTLEKALQEKYKNCAYGYHKKTPPKGDLGEFSKIKEEVLELEDSLKQKNPIMALVELSDLYGAMECFLLKNYPDITMGDLKTMSEATQRSFVNGFRK